MAKGHVYATEIDEKTLDSLRGTSANAGLENVTVIRARADSSALPVSCCDAAFLRGANIDFEPSWFLSTFFPVRDVPKNRGGHGVRRAVVIA